MGWAERMAKGQRGLPATARDAKRDQQRSDRWQRVRDSIDASARELIAWGGVNPARAREAAAREAYERGRDRYQSADYAEAVKIAEDAWQLRQLEEILGQPGDIVPLEPIDETDVLLYVPTDQGSVQIEYWNGLARAWMWNVLGDTTNTVQSMGEWLQAGIAKINAANGGRAIFRALRIVRWNEDYLHLWLREDGTLRTGEPTTIMDRDIPERRTLTYEQVKAAVQSVEIGSAPGGAIKNGTEYKDVVRVGPGRVFIGIDTQALDPVSDPANACECGQLLPRPLKVCNACLRARGERPTLIEDIRARKIDVE